MNDNVSLDHQLCYLQRTSFNIIMYNFTDTVYSIFHCVNLFDDTQKMYGNYSTKVYSTKRKFYI